MHTIKLTPNLLFEYQRTSGKFIRMQNRIEKIDSVAKIELKLFCRNWNALVASVMQTVWRKRSCLESDVFARLCRDASHEVGSDERPQDDRVLTGRNVGDNVAVKVDWDEHDGHLTQLQHTTYSTDHTP